MSNLEVVLKSKTRATHTIKFRFLLIIFFITVPSIGLMYSHSYKEKVAGIERSIALTQDISYQVEQVQRKVLNNSRLFLKRLSKEDFLQTPNTSLCSKNLASIVELNPSYINIGVPLVNGDLVCNALPLTKEINVSDRDYIKRAIQEKVFSISRFQLDRATDKVSVNFAYPIFEKDTDKVIALLVTVVSLDWWSEQLSFYNLPKDSVAFISDANDIIVASYPKKAGNIGKNISIYNINKNVDQLSSTNRVYSQTRLYQRGDLNPIKFTIGIPINEIIERTDHAFYQSLAINIVIVIILSLLAILYLSKDILFHINQLLKAIDDLEEGKIANFTTHSSANEIMLLSNKFKRMAAKRLQSEEASIAKSQELASIFTALPDTYIRISETAQILDYKSSEADNLEVLIGKSIDDLFELDVLQTFHSNIDKIKKGQEVPPWKYSRHNKNLIDTFEVRIVKINNSDELIIIIRDISNREKAEKLIWKQANFDSLTNLPNRKMFLETLDNEIIKKTYNEQKLALLFIDLDHFKEVNDTLGHHVGDMLLKEVAQRLSHCIRQSDVVARLGGDEFTIIMNDIASTHVIDETAQRIIDKICEPILIGDNTCYISPSIGVALYPEDFSDAKDLIKAADQAMFAAKKTGRNRYNYYQSIMQESAIKRMTLLTDLRSAVERNEFKLFYQPIIDMQTGEIKKAEALIRWFHPTQGIVPPDQFISLAEETGLIFPIGSWVVKEASEKIKLFSSHFGESFQMSINISPLQFMSSHNNNNEWIKTIEEFKHADAIILEITESLLMNATREIRNKFQLFSNKGVAIAIDDFGTGYSSLAYIKEYDVDFLKIDQSFVSSLQAHSEDYALCEAIVVMAHKLGIQVVAEGVETKEQYQLLKLMRCDFAQGYYFSRPCDEEAFTKLQKQFFV
ncbi:EAL domain-containing protein [Pseudocolwellia sp. AS88]|uniref:bifunctional diguanylate cyclase/phosphodiesterase n=1 Tax=Pseudocolwellia sp. AS88 TaxID=3063958 RepID=UPI0026EEF0FA|nr:EAL domain-containing protein [Pseudocolwellia sp. AS88]MDO7083868.1 EAL domain-containing protein [Pseudocolwellia sp. AS88]